MASNEVNGQNGPYTGYQNVGAYGRNAALNFQKLGETNREQASKADIRYSEKMSLFDAFGYAAEDIKYFDASRDGALDLNEMSKAFNNNTEISKQYLTVLDRNKDSKVDNTEMAAFILFQDDSAYQFDQSVQAFKNSNLFNDYELQKARDIIGGGIGAKPSADGRITGMERAIADQAVLNAGSITGITLDQFQKQLDLQKVGQTFQQESAKNLPPGGLQTPGYSAAGYTSSGQATDAGGFNSPQMVQTYLQIFVQMLQLMMQLFSNNNTLGANAAVAPR